MDITSSKRELILRDFFRIHGWIADIQSDYRHYMEEIAKISGTVLLNPINNEESCIKNYITYEYSFEGDNYIFTIPAMTTGGYFIIEGSEKVLLIQEVKLQTEPFVTVNDGNIICEMHIESDDYFAPVKISLIDSSIIKLDTSMIYKDIKNNKSIGIWEVITEMFLSDYDEETKLSKLSTLVTSCCSNDEDFSNCMVYILASTTGSHGLNYHTDKEVIRNKIFRGMSDTKIIGTLVTMILICVKTKFGNIKPSDRDSYIFKRLRTPGSTIYNIFKLCLLTYKSKSNLQSTIDKRIYTCLKRGEVTIGGKIYNNMAIQLSKRSTIDKISCVRKIVVPCDENSPNIKMRQIHSSQRGYICPCETPEGKTVGISKHLSCCCLITKDTDISDWIKSNCKDDFFSGSVWVIVDGKVEGWCSKNVDIMKQIKDKYKTVSVVMPQHNIVKINTTSGRPVRPLIVINNRPFDWNDVIRYDDDVCGVYMHMVNNGHIHYVSPIESQYCHIASIGYGKNWKKYKYLEIHPFTMLGLAASLIPFPEHNQSARNVFASSMIKQSLQMQSYEKSSCYLQKPLVSTFIGRTIGYNDNPNGLNLVVAIMSITGYNQEDAIIVKKQCIERGMFSSISTYYTSIIVDNPWEIIDKNGTLTVLSGGIEKTLVTSSPIIINPKIVDIKERIQESGKTKLDITMKEYRLLQLGDKLASRHAQKGVVGMIWSEEDMPFTSKGITPDIIINPHAIPSRMTVGQLIEGVLGKACCINGTFEDGTPFLRNNMKNIQEMLSIKDTEYVTLGTTGESVRTPIAIGMVYYMALKHHAADKIYVRNSLGSKSLFSRQPMSGRSKGGGLRFGEMEYDCLIAHGASKLITEISEHSDMIEAPYCPKCNIITDIFDIPCKLCNTKIITRKVPFSYVVFKDLMLSANIKITI